jgi:haloalkane dehalogenase
MRDFSKAMMRFSWAMSLFGVRQTLDILNPRSRSQNPTGTAGAFDDVTDAMIQQFGDSLRQTFDVGDRLQQEMIDVIFGVLPTGGDYGNGSNNTTGRTRPRGLPAIFSARSSANEDVLITYTRGQGTFSSDKQYIALQNTLYNLDGQENGRHEGVWQALFTSPSQLLARPAVPTGPMDQPVGPVEAFPVSANTIAKWIHADGSSISSVGPAASHLIPLSDGSYLFLVITAQIITQGTGRYAGARGLTQSLGATHVPQGVNLFAPGASPTFPATTLDTFKFVLVRDPPGSKPAPEPAATNLECTGCEVTPNASDSKYVDVHGSKMHYIETGSGEPIVFLHGNPTWSYLWRKVLPLVSPTARCIVPDLIGMGLSDKPDIKYTYFDHIKYVDGFIEKLNLRKYTMVLHDWGCIIGFYHAMQHERNIKGLAFLEAMFQPYSSWNAFPPPIASTFQQFRTPGVGYEKIVVENVFIEQVLPASAMRKFTEAEMNCYRLPFIDPASRKVILMFGQQLPVGGEPADVARATGEYASWLKRTELPKLLIWAKPGLITQEKDVEWARQNLKQLKTAYVGEGLHFLQECHPVEVGNAVARWYRELLSEQRGELRP